MIFSLGDAWSFLKCASSILITLRLHVIIRQRGKYYHPSNAKFWFYGDDPADARLELVDKYLSEFEKIEVRFWDEEDSSIYIHVYQSINIVRNYCSFGESVDITSFGLCRFMNDLVALTGEFQDQCAAIVLGASQDCGWIRSWWRWGQLLHQFISTLGLCASAKNLLKLLSCWRWRCESDARTSPRRQWWASIGSSPKAGRLPVEKPLG